MRRLELTLRKPRFVPYGPLKPTVVIDGRGQPGQWGTGTWQVAADAPTEISVFIFNRMWRFGHAASVVAPGQEALEYRAPALAFLDGELGNPGSTRTRGAWLLAGGALLVVGLLVFGLSRLLG